MRQATRRTRWRLHQQHTRSNPQRPARNWIKFFDAAGKVSMFQTCSVNQICPRPRTLIGLPRFQANAAHAGGDFLTGAAMSYPNYRGTEEQRFWKRVKLLENGCWEWTGGLTDGYGSFALAVVTGQPQRHVRAHRWAYENLVGPVPKGKELDHLCRNRACVNPDHLQAVSKSENILRGLGAPAINSRKQFCKRGHAFSGDNLALTEKGGKIYRRCRECVRVLRGHIRRYSKKQYAKGTK